MSFSLNLKDGLASFTRDLVTAAIRGELEPVSGRDRDIQELIVILLRQSKNNPVLVGDAGVGKTAVVEGLAQRLASGDVPEALKSVRILSLSHIDLIAGTSFRGQYEKRLQSVIEGASSDPGVVLFIDELHNLIGAGTAIGTPMDAANMMKPALAGGRLRVIGATTQSEYELYIRSDSALERRFHPVRIQELTRDQAIEVLLARRRRLEMHHLVAISDEAICAAVDLSQEYLPGRKLPDRCLDLLDMTCAHMQVNKGTNRPGAVEELNRKRTELLAQERVAVDDIIAIALARGTPLEAFSRGTYRVLEIVGQGVETLITGQKTERQPLPPPDSIRRLQSSDPAGRLAQSHQERLLIEDRLRDQLDKSGLSVTAEHVKSTLHRPSDDQP
jgi:ATP-dependent Clp protease ATP-binding subunit ClpA